MTPDWTPWAPLDPPVHLTSRSLAELIDGGQAFRWWLQSDGTYLGQWSHHQVALRAPSASPDTPAPLEWSAPHAQANQLGTQLPTYLGYTTAQTAALDQLPWRSDAHLARCIAAFPGLRILHQPLGETLLGFLCSATKQIVQIKQMLALLAEHHGSQTSSPSESSPPPSSAPPHRLPTWAQLAEVPEIELRKSQLGFRAKYIAGTARFLAEHPGWLEETGSLPYADAKTRLLMLPGVGEKIADCVLLFGAGKLEAFPVDTWMIKAMAKRYQLTDWSPPQVAHFGRTHFGPAAGLAQQYLFAWERAHGKAHPGNAEPQLGI
jgi:N-glycosylase/DNA lyase